MNSSTLYKLNHILYYARTKKIIKDKITKNIKKLFEITLEHIKDTASDESIYKFAGLKDKIDDESLNTVEQNFKKLDPLRQWRGKFFYEFFIIFLSLLKEDRCQRTPIYFKEKKSVKFNPNNDIFRVLSESLDIPECIYSFFTKNHKLLRSVLDN